MSVKPKDMLNCWWIFGGIFNQNDIHQMHEQWCITDKPCRCKYLDFNGFSTRYLSGWIAIFENKHNTTAKRDSINFVQLIDYREDFGFWLLNHFIRWFELFGFWFEVGENVQFNLGINKLCVHELKTNSIRAETLRVVPHNWLVSTR